MGNLDSLRDWEHARDCVERQWLMLKQSGSPEDFVIATGRQETVRRLLNLLWSPLDGMLLNRWGQGVDEVGKRKTREIFVRIDPHYFRSAEVETLLGEPSKAHEKLAWFPTTTSEELSLKL